MNPSKDIVTESFVRKPFPVWAGIALGLSALSVLMILIWQGIAAHGAPDPTVENTPSISAILDIAVLVFREGLECVLVLSALTASMVGVRRSHCRPVATGVGIGFIGTVMTWFIAIKILDSLTENVSALNLQAATGFLAIVVLLIIMNWFFHKTYWGGWISFHNRKKKELTQTYQSGAYLFWGLVLLGFSSFYREGFEVVLFLQSYRLKLGTDIVLLGALLGFILSGIVAILTFITHHRLPYRKMLILTGVLLGVVLLVMVGEQAQEMQQAHWISTTEIKSLDWIPAWMGVWFSLFPTVETISSQLLAAAIVIGSYFLVSRSSLFFRRSKHGTVHEAD